jgi:hypothetical protein
VPGGSTARCTARSSTTSRRGIVPHRSRRGCDQPERREPT